MSTDEETFGPNEAVIHSPQESQGESIGVVSHQDQFTEPETIQNPENASEPAPVSDTLFERGSGIPFHAASTPTGRTRTLRSLPVLVVHAIQSGLHGGMSIQATNIYQEPVELLVRSVCSLSMVPDYSDQRISQVSLKTVASDLFLGHSETNGQQWQTHLQDVVLPVIELLENTCLGSHAKHAVNPVTDFFFGLNGILYGATDRETVTRKIEALTQDIFVTVVARYHGAAMIVVYEP